MSKSRIDKTILAIAKPRWLKVARVIVDVARAEGVGVAQTEQGFRTIAERIEALVREGELVALGDLSKWRHSEVRLPGPLVTAPAPNACVRNLRMLDGVKHFWAAQNHKGVRDIPTWEDLRPYLGQAPRCPQHGTYKLGRVEEPPKCSYGRTHTLPQ